MTYNKLKIHWIVILLISAVLLGFYGCNRNKPYDGSKDNPQKHHSLTEEVEEFEPEELSFDSILQPFDANAYYVGECQSSDGAPGKLFVLTLDAVKNKSVSATFYDITDSLKNTVKPEKITLSIQSRKVIVTHSGNELVMKRIGLAKTGTGIKGSFNLDKASYEFSLHRCNPPEYTEFEGRYEKETFPYKISQNVKYGEAMGYWTSNVTDNLSYFKIFAKGVSESMKKKKLDLLMDVYLPDNDNFASRPLILFIHGGAFYILDKADHPITLWCKHFAACGYVVASINYRMGFQLTKSSIERCGYSALQDAHAAIRFLLSKKGEYGINPDYIFVAGSSAGAITSLNLAFMRNNTRPASSREHGRSADLGDIESSGNTIQQSFRVRAVANMWGAVSDLNLLNSTPVSIISFHGDADQIVPYDSGVPLSNLKANINTLLFDKMYGSASIHRKAQQLGYRSELHTFKGAGHSPHVDKSNQPNSDFYFIQEHITDFFYGEFVPSSTSVKREPDRPQWFRLDADGLKEVRWKVEGGFILQTDGNRAHVVFVDGKPHALQASALWKNGAARVFSADL